MHHWLGNQGMPRRYVDYLPTDGFTALHAVSSIGAFLLGISTLPFLWNVLRSYRFGRKVAVDDPWGFGNSLEWATSCPPPRHNLTELPRIRSERPAFELHYPHMVDRFRREAHAGGRPSPYEVAAQQVGPPEPPPRDDPRARCCGRREPRHQPPRMCPGVPMRRPRIARPGVKSTARPAGTV
ncbi:hypothetical protein [Pseudonocardia oceani]|uniref:hypothetical protein n=1 Tax=Pseudonocardia oceani TaxID=2792013 RepID=UPI001CF7BF66